MSRGINVQNAGGMGGMGGMGGGMMGGMGGGMMGGMGSMSAPYPMSSPMSSPMMSPPMMSSSSMGGRSSKRMNKYGGGSGCGLAQADCGTETRSSVDTKAAPSTLTQTEDSNALF